MDGSTSLYGNFHDAEGYSLGHFKLLLEDLGCFFFENFDNFIDVLSRKCGEKIYFKDLFHRCYSYMQFEEK